MTERVAVVGGGAVGVTAAHDLADRGADVTLYERADLANGASGRAAGIVYDAFAEDRDARIAARALERFRDLAAAGAIDLTPRPYVWLAREGDEHAADAIREQVPRMRAHDRDVERLSGDALGERFPGLATGDVAVAAMAVDAASLDPQSYVTAMADRAREAGVDVRTETAATLSSNGPVVATADGRTEFDTVLVAAGAHTARVLADASHEIAMKPYRVQAMVTGPVADDVSPECPVPMLWDATDSFYFRPWDDGFLVGDGTEEREFDPDDYDEIADPEFLDHSRDRLRGALHGLDSEVSVDRSWAGLCTATPDRNPLLGPVDDAERLFVATGWHGHGFMRSPALGETIAEQILGGDGYDAFDPRRFDGDESFRVVEGMTVED